MESVRAKLTNDKHNNLNAIVSRLVKDNLIILKYVDLKKKILTYHAKNLKQTLKHTSFVI
jgi:hypothetical protein